VGAGEQLPGISAPRNRQIRIMNRRTVAAMVVVASLVGAGIPILMSDQLPGDLGAMTEATRSSSASPLAEATSWPRTAPPPGEPSPPESPAEGTAGSVGLAEDFDRMVTGGDVSGWEVEGKARLEVAALPTAVQRSARLTADVDGSACRSLPPDMQRLAAAFMLDALPPAEIAALALMSSGNQTVALTIAPDGRSTLSGRLTPAFIRAGTWYRWSVVAGSGAVTTSLLDDGGNVLAEHAIDGDDGLGDSFCLSTRAPARVHLDSLTMENP
jgi:hypothetical protein